jgi:transposase-like protein
MPIASWKRSLKKWDESYPTISQMWRWNWEHLTRFYAYPADIRKVIYTTDAVESLNMSLRKVIKTRGSFQEAATKLLFLALEHMAKSGPGRCWIGRRPCSGLPFCSESECLKTR